MFKKLFIILPIMFVSIITINCRTTKKMIKNNDINNESGYLCGTYSRDYDKFIGDPYINIFISKRTPKEEDMQLVLEMPKKEKGTFMFKLPTGKYVLSYFYTQIGGVTYEKFAHSEFEIKPGTAHYWGFFQLKYTSPTMSKKATFQNDIKNIPETDKKVLLEEYPSIKLLKFEVMK